MREVKQPLHPIFKRWEWKGGIHEYDGWGNWSNLSILHWKYENEEHKTGEWYLWPRLYVEVGYGPLVQNYVEVVWEPLGNNLGGFRMWGRFWERVVGGELILHHPIFFLKSFTKVFMGIFERNERKIHKRQKNACIVDNCLHFSGYIIIRSHGKFPQKF